MRRPLRTAMVIPAATLFNSLCISKLKVSRGSFSSSGFKSHPEFSWNTDINIWNARFPFARIWKVKYSKSLLLHFIFTLTFRLPNGLPWTVPPVIEEFKFDSKLQSGMRTRIYCNVAQGDAPVQLKWFKDGILIGSSPGGSSFHHHNHNSQHRYGSHQRAASGSGSSSLSKRQKVASKSSSSSSGSSSSYNPSPVSQPHHFQSSHQFYEQKLLLQQEIKSRSEATVSSGAAAAVPTVANTVSSSAAVAPGSSSSLDVAVTDDANDGDLLFKHHQQFQSTSSEEMVPGDGFEMDHLHENSDGDMMMTFVHDDENTSSGAPSSSSSAMSLSGIKIREIDEFSLALVIENLNSKDHNGNYSCVASNDASIVNHSAQLIVNGESSVWSLARFGPLMTLQPVSQLVGVSSNPFPSSWCILWFPCWCLRFSKG